MFLLEGYGCILLPGHVLPERLMRKYICVRVADNPTASWSSRRQQRDASTIANGDRQLLISEALAWTETLLNLPSTYWIVPAQDQPCPCDYGAGGSGGPCEAPMVEAPADRGG
jgi:hypothetical protein